MSRRVDTWAVDTGRFTTYVDGGLALTYRMNGAGELVPCAVVGNLVLELEPGASIRPAEPAGRPE